MQRCFLCLRSCAWSSFFFCQARGRGNSHFPCYSTQSLLPCFACLFPLKCLSRKPCRSGIAALCRIPCCLWDNDVQCKQVLTCSGQLGVPVPFPGQAIWVIVLVLGLGFSLGQQGISFWGTVSALI